MARYIDADAFFADFAEIRDYEYASQDYEVDAVEVVRCRDCKYAHMLTFENGIHCLSCNYQNAHGMLVENHGFCYWGERREDGD